MTTTRYRFLAALSLCLLAGLIVGAGTAVGGATDSDDTVTADVRLAVENASGQERMDQSVSRRENASRQETTPVIRAWLNGERVARGDYELYQHNPMLQVNVSVGPGAGGATMEDLTIRVNRRTFRSYEFNSATGSITTELRLRPGNNSVRIIATDSAGHVNVTTFEVGKDDMPPLIGLFEPYRPPVQLSAPIPDGSITRAVTDIGFRVGEFTGIREGNVAITYGGTPNGLYEGEQTTYRVFTPGPRFTRSGLFGNGTNRVRVILTDRAGNSRIREFTINASDTQPPNITLGQYPANTTSPIIDLSGTVSDDFWVRNVTIFVDHVNTIIDSRNTSVVNITGRTEYTRIIRPNTTYRYSRSGLNVSFETGLDLRVGYNLSDNGLEVLEKPGINRIRIRAVDHLGNVTWRNITIKRYRDLGNQNDPPRISFDLDQFRLQNGRLRVVTEITDPNWNLQTVELETRNNLSSTDAIGYELFSGLARSYSTRLNTTIEVGPTPGETVLEVRARDEAGGRTLERLYLSEVVARLTPTTPTPTATATATPTPTPTSAPTPTASTPPIAGTTTGPAPSSSGGLLGTVLGFLGTVAPFLVGGLVFATIAFVVLRRIRGGEAE